MLRIVAAEEIVSVEIPDPVIYVMSPPAVEGMQIAQDQKLSIPAGLCNRERSSSRSDSTGQSSVAEYRKPSPEASQTQAAMRSIEPAGCTPNLRSILSRAQAGPNLMFSWCGTLYTCLRALFNNVLSEAFINGTP